MNTIGKIILGIGLTISSWFGYHQPVESPKLTPEIQSFIKQNIPSVPVIQQIVQPVKTITQKLGATNYNPSGGGTYRLQSSIGSSDTSLTLSSFKEPVSNILYTMSYLNSSIEYATLEPGSSNKKEFVSFSGITQNADGTATLTGLVRGLSFSYPYTASTTLQQTHSGQSVFILSNPPQLTNQYANKTNSESINPCGASCGTWTFASTSPPQYDASITATGNQFVSANQLNATAIAGAPTSTEATQGISTLATQANLGNASTTSGSPIIVPSRLATSSPVAVSGYIPVTGSGGKISSAFIATTSPYSWTGLQTFGTATTSLNATTSIAATPQTPLCLNGLCYDLPAGRGASSTVPMEDGNGHISFNPLDWIQLVSTSTPTATTTMNIPITSKSDLRIIVDSKGATNGGGGGLSLYFNGDSASHYSYRQFENYALVSSAFSTTVGIVLDAVGSTTPSYFDVRVNNPTSYIKGVSWTGGNIASTSANVLTGSGSWNNTNAQINMVTIKMISDTFIAGTRVKVFGSRD